jgi:hypothetical protein
MLSMKHARVLGSSDVKKDFYRTGRATGSIALGTCKEKSDSVSLGRNPSTSLASFIPAHHATKDSGARRFRRQLFDAIALFWLDGVASTV